MHSCWRAEPLDRPTFSVLRLQLEKLLESLPEVRDGAEVIYINTQFPECGEGQADSPPLAQQSLVLDPNSVLASCAPNAAISMVTAQVHEDRPHEGRYILNGASRDWEDLPPATPATGMAGNSGLEQEDTHVRSQASWSHPSTQGGPPPDKLLFADDDSGDSEVLV